MLPCGPSSRDRQNAGRERTLNSVFLVSRLWRRSASCQAMLQVAASARTP